MCGKWKDVLIVAASVSISFCSCTPRGIDTDGLQFTLPTVTVYRVICERLEAVDRVTDAIECLHDMMNGLGGEVYTSEPITEWVSGKFMFCLFVCHTFNLLVRFHPPVSLRCRE